MPCFEFPTPERQLFVRDFLASVRETGLRDALRRATKKVPAMTLRNEICRFAPEAGLHAVQGTGIRDEDVFATPSLLRG